VKGPVFANIILADEINRTPPKTQSALLEAMQEKAITVAGHSHKLSEPFFVLATQNPIEQEGTYPLPEAQLDRFMFNIWLDYPSHKEEINVVRSTTQDVMPEPEVVLQGEEIIFFQNLIRKVPVPDNVYEYAVNLTTKTRPSTKGSHPWAQQYLTWGAGPRASQYLIIGAKCNAVLNGKYAPDIEDVRAISIPILRHRIVRNYKAEADGQSVEMIIKEFLK
jgi:MoxR-like ATPase